MIVSTVKADTVYVVSRNVVPGRLVLKERGHDGLKRKFEEVELKGGHVVSTHVIRVEVTEAKPTVYLISPSPIEASRSGFIRNRVITMEATAYVGSHGSHVGYTRSGREATFGVVAVDPRVIPLGTWLYIDNYGLAIAADTGSAIKGNRIDLCYDSNHKVNAFGRRDVTVHVLASR